MGSCISGLSGVCGGKEKERKESKDILKTIAEGVDKVQDATYKAGNKAAFQERRLMTGHQGYQITEAMRQVQNGFDEWDIERSKFFFTGVVHSECKKWINAKGGRIEPHEAVWR